VESGELGRLHSVFLATRMRRGTPQAEATERLWEAIDFVQALAAGAHPVRAHAIRGAVPHDGAARDDAILLINLRFERDIIATIEVSAGMAADAMLPDPETEIEICGTQGALRVEPYHEQACSLEQGFVGYTLAFSHALPPDIACALIHMLASHAHIY